MQRLLDDIDEKATSRQAVLALLFGNLATTCEKTLRPNLAAAFQTLARSCAIRARRESAGKLGETDRNAVLAAWQKRLVEERRGLYAEGLVKAPEAADRNALRCFTWGQKVTAIQASLLKRFLKADGDMIRAGEQVYVCEACGFMTIKGEAPDRCPICNAPASRFFTPDPPSALA